MTNDPKDIVAIIAKPITAQELVENDKPTTEQQANSLQSTPDFPPDFAQPPTEPTAATPQEPEASPQPSQPVVSDPPISITPEELLKDTERRGRGRPPGSKNKKTIEGDGSPSVLPPPEPIPVPTVNYQLLSEMVFDTGAATLTMTFGQEWQPRTPDERGNVCGALAKYLEAKQVQDIPPGMLLTIVLVAYSMPRLKEPTTAGKIKLGWLWIRNKFSRKKKAVTA